MSAIVADILADAYVIHREQLAFHEIGHALIAHRCGRTVGRIEVNSRGGCMRSEGVSSPLIGLLCAISGDRAEYLAAECAQALVGFGHNQDQRDAERCLNLIASGPIEREWILEDARRQVDEVLEQERDRLDRIARMLLQRRTLEARELRTFL